jgi:hypothetical protein
MDGFDLVKDDLVLPKKEQAVSSSAVHSVPQSNTNTLGRNPAPALPQSSVPSSMTLNRRRPEPFSSPSPLPMQNHTTDPGLSSSPAQAVNQSILSMEDNPETGQSPPSRKDLETNPQQQLGARKNQEEEKAAILNELSAQKLPQPAAPQQNHGSIPDLERPLKPVTREISFDDFDETSVPPGHAPSRGQLGIPVKPALKTAKEKDKKPASPKSDTPSPSKLDDAPAASSPTPMAKGRNSMVVKKVTTNKPAANPSPIKEEPSVTHNGPFSRNVVPPFDFEEDPATIGSQMPDVSSLLGDAFVTALLSKAFMHKEWALSFVNGELITLVKEHGTHTVDADRIVSCCYSILLRTFPDNREKVSILTVQLWKLIAGKTQVLMDSCLWYLMTVFA